MGSEPRKIGDYVVHTSASMTDRYRHLLDDAHPAAAAALDALLASGADAS